MIFAAGLGTRLKPMTDTRPKALVEIDGHPLLWHVIMKLKSAGFTRIVVNVHHFASQIIDYLNANDHFGLDIRISDERARLLDTGGGIKAAASLFSPTSPILIHNVDIFSNVDVAAFYQSIGKADAALLVSSRETSRYLVFNDAMQLRGWVNVKTGERKNESLFAGESTLIRAFSGIHVFSPRLFQQMQSWPEAFGIIDFYLQACIQHEIRGVEMEGLQLLDVGKADSLQAATSLYLQGAFGS